MFEFTVRVSLEAGNNNDVEVNTSLAIDGEEDTNLDMDSTRIEIRGPLSDLYAKALNIVYDKSNATVSVATESMLNDTVITIAIAQQGKKEPVTNAVDVTTLDITDEHISDILQQVGRVPHQREKTAVIAFKGLTEASEKRVRDLCAFCRFKMVTSVEEFQSLVAGIVGS